jgi:hypothetical protein
MEGNFLNCREKKTIPIRTVKDTNSPPWIYKEVLILIRKTYCVL